jgi:hypothetical protein
MSSSTTVIGSSASGLSTRSSPGTAAADSVRCRSRARRRSAYSPPWTARRGLDSWHLATLARRVLSAGAAAEPFARLLPGGRPLAFVFRSFPGITDRLLPLGCGSPGSLGAAAADRRRLRAEAAMVAVIAPIQPRHGQPRRPRNSTSGGERRGSHRWPSAHRRRAAVSHVSTLAEMLRRIPHGC